MTVLTSTRALCGLALVAARASAFHPALARRCALARPSRVVRRMSDEAAGEAAPVGEYTELSRLEIRVGMVVEVSAHPDRETLLVEKIDVGEAEPRTIASGIAQFVTPEQLQAENVVVLCNLKPRPVAGVMSAGMLMCASNDDAVVPLRPPAGAAVGEAVTFDGVEFRPDDPGNRASKALKKIGKFFKTDADGVATHEGKAFTTTAGPVRGAMTYDGEAMKDVTVG